MDTIAGNPLQEDMPREEGWDGEERRRSDAEWKRQIQAHTAELAEANRALEADIARRKEVEEALRHAEEQYRTIFENAVEGIFQTPSEVNRNISPASKGTETCR